MEQGPTTLLKLPDRAESAGIKLPILVMKAEKCILLADRFDQ